MTSTAQDGGGRILDTSAMFCTAGGSGDPSSIHLAESVFACVFACVSCYSIIVVLLNTWKTLGAEGAVRDRSDGKCFVQLERPFPVYPFSMDSELCARRSVRVEKSLCCIVSHAVSV